MSAVTQSLFDVNVIDPTEFLTMKQEEQPLQVFNSFVKPEDNEFFFADESPLLEDETLFPGELSAQVVDELFSATSDSIVMFPEQTEREDAWESLFDDSNIAAVDSKTAAPAPAPAPAPVTVTPAGFLPTPAMEDNQKVPSRAVSIDAGKVKKPKVDHLGVVSYNRKQRAAPLSPIVVENEDPVSMKRARNTEAARRSRARKLERMSQLESRVEELLSKNTALEAEVARLKSLLGQQ